MHVLKLSLSRTGIFAKKTVFAITDQSQLVMTLKAVWVQCQHNRSDELKTDALAQLFLMHFLFVYSYRVMSWQHIYISVS